MSKASEGLADEDIIISQDAFFRSGLAEEMVLNLKENEVTRAHLKAAEMDLLTGDPEIRNVDRNLWTEKRYWRLLIPVVFLTVGLIWYTGFAYSTVNGYSDKISHLTFEELAKPCLG